MRKILGLLLALMLIFGAVQYNDPDGFLWMGIYTIPALWCAVGLFFQPRFTLLPVQIAYWASVMSSVVGVIYFWPMMPNFWTKDVWYNVETAREGMGLMIVLAVLLFVKFAIGRSTGSLEGIKFDTQTPQT